MWPSHPGLAAPAFDPPGGVHPPGVVRPARMGDRGCRPPALLRAAPPFNAFGALPSMGGRAMTQGRFACSLYRAARLLSGLLLVVGFWWIWDDLGFRAPTFPRGAGMVAGAVLTFLCWLGPSWWPTTCLPRRPARSGDVCSARSRPRGLIFGAASRRGRVLCFYPRALPPRRTRTIPRSSRRSRPRCSCDRAAAGPGAAGGRVHEPHARWLSPTASGSRAPAAAR